MPHIAKRIESDAKGVPFSRLAIPLGHVAKAVAKSATPDTEINQCLIEGDLRRSSLNPLITALLDHSFEKISMTGNSLEFTIKPGIVLAELVAGMNYLSRSIHGQTLVPSDELIATLSNNKYNRPLLSPVEDRQIVGVPDSGNKNYLTMRYYLAEQCRPSLMLAERESGGSIVGVNLILLLTGKNPLEGSQELRDSSGVLYSIGDGKLSFRNGFDNAFPNLRALGSR